jgi:hypothetical protein
MIRCYKVRLESSGPWIWCDDLKQVQDAVEAAIGDGPTGETCTVEVAEMAEEKRENLPDFEGF